MLLEAPGVTARAAVSRWPDGSGPAGFSPAILRTRSSEYPRLRIDSITIWVVTNIMHAQDLCQPAIEVGPQRDVILANNRDPVIQHNHQLINRHTQLFRHGRRLRWITSRNFFVHRFEV